MKCLILFYIFLSVSLFLHCLKFLVLFCRAENWSTESAEKVNKYNSYCWTLVCVCLTQTMLINEFIPAENAE